MDMGRSHWNNGVNGMFLISMSTKVLIVRDKILGRIPTMIHVHTWSHTLNNVRFLVGDFSKEHGRLITYIKKLHQYGESYCLLTTFYTRTYVCFTKSIVLSLAAGQTTNAQHNLFLHLIGVGW